MELNSQIIQELYRPGDYIFFEGDIDFHFYIVQEGEVQIFTKTSSGQRVDITTVMAGESFGEFALLDKKPRSASAQALTECRLVRVTEEGYQELLAELPGWASSMLKSFSHRIKMMNDRLKDLPQFVKTKNS
jgi:CRP-like cAMP-binding protein